MKKLFILALVLLAASQSFALNCGIRTRDDYVPQPQLLEPNKDTADISGKEYLVFSWSPHEQTRGFRAYYDFRLYNGYDMLASTLIMKKRVDPHTFSLKLPSSMFEDGRVYTWSLKQVYDPIRKSLRSFNSFKVIKKE